jgi:hypothetical protein
MAKPKVNGAGKGTSPIMNHNRQWEKKGLWINNIIYHRIHENVIK